MEGEKTARLLALNEGRAYEPRNVGSLWNLEKARLWNSPVEFPESNIVLPSNTP